MMGLAMLVVAGAWVRFILLVYQEGDEAFPSAMIVWVVAIVIAALLHQGSRAISKSNDNS